MKKLFLTLLLVFPLLAQAWQWEVGVGRSHTTTMGNGTWYQDGFPHTLDLTHATWKLGVTGELQPGWNWHAGYASLGVNHADSLAVADAEYSNATHGCTVPNCNVGHYMWSGSTNGVYATVGKVWELAPRVKVELSAGPFVFKPTSRVTVDHWLLYTGAGTPYTIHADGDVGLRPGAVLAAGISLDNIELSLQRYFNKGLRMQYTGIQKYTDVLMLTWKF